MRAHALAGLGLAIVLALPAAAVDGTPGPFVGQLRNGQSRTHQFDNNPSGNPCVDLAATYTVSLAYAPPTDTLTLNVGGTVDTGSGGGASVTLTQGVCAAFPITVTATSVANVSPYVVTVTRQLLGPIS